MPSWDVIYRAVADFSDLTSKAEKAKLTLKELEDASNKTSDAEARGAAKAAAANDLDAKAIRNRGSAMEKAAAQALLYNKAVNNGGATSASEYISNLQREQSAQTLLERARQRGFQTPQQNYSFKQQEIGQQNLYNKATWAGYATPQQYLQYLSQLRKSMDDENSALSRHNSLIKEASTSVDTHSKNMKGLQGSAGLFGTQIASVQAYADALNSLPDNVSTDAKFNDAKASQTVLGFKSLLDSIPETLRAKLQLDDTGLDQTLTEDKLKLDAFGNVIVSPDAQLDDHGFASHITSLKNQMLDLGKQVADPQARLNISEFQQRMAQIRAELAALKKQSATVDVTDRVNTRQIAAAEKAFADLARNGQKAFGQVTRSADSAFNEIDHHSDSSASRTTGTWNRIRHALSGVFSDFRHTADDAFSGVEGHSRTSSRNVGSGWSVVGHLLKGVFHDFDIAGRDAATETERTFRRAGEVIGDSVKTGSRRAYEAFDGLVDKFEKGGKRVVTALGPMGAAIGAVIAILPQLTTAAQAAGSSIAALPTFMFAGAASIGVLKKAFDHVGPALADYSKSVLGGAKAQDKFNKAMQGLPEPAQQAIKSLEPFIDFWKKNTSITTRFFDAVNPGLKGLSNEILPNLKKTLDSTATALGNVFSKGLSGLGKFVQSKDWTEISQNSTKVITLLGDAVIRVADGFGHIAAAAAPFATWLSQDIDNVAKKFDNWAQAQDKAGSQLKRWLGFAKEAFKGLDIAMKGIVQTIEIIGGATPKFNSKGELTGVIPSDQQNKNMKSFVDLMTVLGKVVLPNLGVAFRALSEMPADVADSVVKLLGAVAQLVGTIVSAPGFQGALVVTLKFITGIADVLTDVAKWKPAGDIIGGILGVFTALAVLKFTGIFALLEKIKSVGPLISKLTGGKFGWSVEDPSSKITAAGEKAATAMGDSIKVAGDQAAEAMGAAIRGGGKVAGAEEAAGEAEGGRAAGVEQGLGGGLGKDAEGAASGGALSKLLGKLGLGKLAGAGGAGLEAGGLGGLAGAAGGVGLGVIIGQMVNSKLKDIFNSGAKTPFGTIPGVKLGGAKGSFGGLGGEGLGTTLNKAGALPTSIPQIFEQMGNGKLFTTMWKLGFPYFKRDVLDPISHFMSGPFVRFFTDTIPRWFKPAGQFFMRDVEKPIQNFATNSIPHFFTSTIPRWFAPVGGFFSRDVIRPISNFATKTIPHFFTSTIPSWFRSAGQFFSRDVIRPISNFATKTLPHFFTSTIPSWFKSASGVFSRDVIRPISNFATKTLPHFFTSTIPSWFKGVSGVFSRDVVKPLSNFITKTIPHFFTSTIPSWFKNVSGAFSRDVIKPLSNFITKTIPHFFTSTIPSWFKNVSGAFSRDVIRPLQNFITKTLPHFFTSTIPSWFKSASGFFSRDVIHPVQNFVTKTLPHFFTSTIPGWFKSVGTWFSRDVIKPIDTFITHTVPHWFTATIPGWFKSVTSWFRRDVINPISHFVTSTLPHFFTSTIPHWFAIAGSWFNRDVVKPVGHFITSSIPGFFTRTIPHWFSGVAGWFNKQVIQPIEHFFTSLPSKIGNVFKSAGSGVLHGIEHFLGLESGGEVPEYAAGTAITKQGRKSGSIPGAGEHDNQLILAQPGEFMLRKGARMAIDQRFGPNFLNAVNHADMPGMLKQAAAQTAAGKKMAGGGIVGYAAGGQIGGAQSINTSAIIQAFTRNVERPINTYVERTLPAEFKLSGSKWFNQITPDFNKQVNVIQKFANNTVQGYWNSSIKKWFDSVPNVFDKEVKNPIQKFAGTGIQGTWNSSVNKWFDSAQSLFRKNVEAPIQKFAGSSVQSTWNSSINKWFDSAQALFRKNVINPIQSFAGNSLQSTWNNSINKWFDSAQAAFRKNVINPVQQFAGNAIQSTWNNSVGKWFDSASAAFRKNVMDPIHGFLSNTIESWFNNSVGGWFNSAWGQFKKQLSDPINNFVSHTIQGWWNNSAGGWFNNAWGKFKSQLADPINNFVSHTLQGWWNNSVSGWFNSAWGFFKKQLTDNMNGFISHTVQGWWNSSIGGWFNSAWPTFGRQFATPLHGYINTTVPHLWGNSSAHWFSGVWNHFKTQVANPIAKWFNHDLPHSIESAFKGSINWVISNVINKVIVFINDIGKKAGIAAISKVQTLAEGGGVAHNFMKLGPGSVGGAGDHDTQPILATPGEFVVRKSARQALDRTFGPDMMNQINNADRVLGFAGGGKIPPSYIENGMAFADGGSVPKKKGSPGGNQAISGGAIAQYAEKFAGHRYVLGGSGDYQHNHNPPFGPWDCAGFVAQMYEHFGMTGGPLAAPNAPNLRHWSKKSGPVTGGMVFFSGAEHGNATNPGHVGMVTGPNKSIQAMDEALGTRNSDLGGNLGFGVPPNGFVGGGDGTISFGKPALADFGKVFGAEGTRIADSAKKKTGLTFAQLIKETVTPLIAAKLPPGSFSANAGQLMIKDIEAVAQKEITAKEATLGGDGSFSGTGGTAVYTYLLNNVFGGHKIAAAGATASMYGESSWNPDSQDCVPLSYKVVTTRGILRHDEVKVGDYTPVWNPETKRVEDAEILEIPYHPAAPICVMGNDTWSVICTVDHRWITSDNEMVRAYNLELGKTKILVSPGREELIEFNEWIGLDDTYCLHTSTGTWTTYRDDEVAAAEHQEPGPIWTGNTGGRGLIGWTPKSTLPDSAFTGNPTKDMKAQLPLISKFIQTSGDEGVIQRMKSATTILEAANEWGKGVERFGINDVHGPGLALAKQIMDKVSAGKDAGNKPAKGTPAGKGPQSPANAKHLAAGGPVKNAVDAATGEANTREAMLLGSYLTSDWNTGYKSGARYGPFGITIPGADPKNKITAAQAQNPLWAAKHMLPKYQAGVAKYGHKTEPYNAEQAAAFAEGTGSFYSSKGQSAVKTAWQKVLSLMGVDTNKSSAGGAPNPAGGNLAGDPAGGFSTVATGSAAQDKTWMAAAPALLKDVEAEAKSYNTLIGHKPKSNTTAYKNAISAIKGTHPAMISAYEALSGGWGKQIPRFLPGQKGTGGSSVGGVLVHTGAQNMWKKLESTSSAHVSALTKNATAFKNQAPNDYAAELAQAKAVAAEAKTAYAAWIADRSQPQTANKTLAYTNALKTLLADYTAEAKTYATLFGHGPVQFSNVTTGKGKAAKTTVKKSNANAEDTKRWNTYAMPALRTWHANLSTRDSQLAGEPTDGTIDVTNDLTRFKSSIDAGQSVIKTHPILAKLAPDDTKAESAALAKLATDYAATFSAWSKFNAGLPHQVGSASPGPVGTAPTPGGVAPVDVMSMITGGPAAATFAKGGVIPSPSVPITVPLELQHGAANGAQFLRENKPGDFDIAKLFAFGGPVPASFSSMPASIGEGGMQHLAKGGNVERNLSDAAAASGGGNSAPFMQGDIHVHNPVREKAGESVTRNVQRLALLAGRGIA